MLMTDHPSCWRAVPRLAFARAAGVVVALLALALWVAYVPARLVQLQAPCTGAACGPLQPTLETARALRDAGFSLPFYAVATSAVEVTFVLVFVVIAAVLYRRRPDEPMALFGAFFLVLFGTTFVVDPATLVGTHPALRVPDRLVRFLMFVSLPLFFYLFPSGRFVPRWTRALALGWVGWRAILALFPASPAALLMPVLWPVFLASWVFAQIYRYRRVSGLVERQQTKWVVAGCAAALAGGTALRWLKLLVPALERHTSLAAWIVDAGFLCCMACIPLAIGIAILRGRLFDIDILINRALVYGALTACVVGLYALVVGGAGALFRARGEPAIALLATALVAILFQPLRDRLHRGVNRLLYGERDEPYAVIVRLGRRLETTLAPDAVLPTIVDTVAQALKLPYAAIALGGDGAGVVAAATGTPVAEPLRLPLLYHAEPVGELLLAPRAPGEPFSPGDRRLLDDLARQAGVAARAVLLHAQAARLAADLQRSRERLVTAREEERRRLRRDLHDGLGSQLAGLSIQTAALRRLIPPELAAVHTQVDELQTDLRAAVANIRRLVYGLRPPALDEVGLVAALRERAALYSGGGARSGGQASGAVVPWDLQVTVEVAEPLPPLSAATEVAIYRIVEEALTNVVRHARARRCVVRLAVADGVRLVIEDDGVGLAPHHGVGVGLLSMRERAEELGGSCVIEPAPASGTRVTVCLPVPRVTDREAE